MNVPVSNAMASTSSNKGHCDGHNHGDHIEDPANCSLFFRCVWGRMISMNCPQGTVFNSRLSVCDYPDQVVRCQSKASF